MKRLFLLFTLIFAFIATSNAQLAPGPQPVVGKNKVQIAILFDTSGSMDGLIEQAKSVIWQIVNAASKLSLNGEHPKLEIALYDYGNDGIQNEVFVRQQCSFISDLDSISEKLFALYTNGGSEFCASVIHKSISDLTWTNEPNDVRLIYIAGNEPFNQGKEDYKEVIFNATKQGVIVNTIYCGPYEQGVTEFWYDGAMLSQGNYFNIDSNREIEYIKTPYDSIINVNNTYMNTTYMFYGSEGEYKFEKQAAADQKAGSKNQAALTERSISKSNYNYLNSSWDLIDAYKADSTVLQKLKDNELPKDMQGKTAAEKQQIIEQKLAERTAYQNKINELAKEREKYIADEKAKRAAETGQNDLGTSVIQSMNSIAAKKGYKSE